MSVKGVLARMEQPALAFVIRNHIYAFASFCSFKRKCYVFVQPDREEGYELTFRLRTTPHHGVVPIGQGLTFFTLQLDSSKLKLHSSMLAEYEGVTIGEDLNITGWQKVHVAANNAPMTIGLDDRIQVTTQINPDTQLMGPDNFIF